MANRLEFLAFMKRLSVAIPKFAPKIDDAALEVWFAELGELGTPALTALYRELVSIHDSFPSLREALLAAGKAPQSDESVARDVAARIWATIEQGGSLLARDRLAEKLGSVGVEVVNMAGGWRAICDLATYANAPTLQAQWRGLAEGAIKKQRAGILIGQWPELPSSASDLKRIESPAARANAEKVASVFKDLRQNLNRGDDNAER